ncbi:protein translocase subunit SecF [Candidatus Pacearchaeota archaeon]|nr:hypothetical protein [uncultured archaeon]MBS3076642.1 protein translocase subunit SecF [Candidatus Pacearchaeota archaeon]
MTNWYDKNYKKILILPVALLIVCLVYLFFFYNSHGDIIYRDIGLSGGTTITLQGDYDQGKLESSLNLQLDDVQVRSIGDLSTGKQLALIISSSAQPDVLTEAIENDLNIKLTAENSNVEFSGPSLGGNFYRQLIISLIISFFLMSLVIFLLFRTFVPSIAVIFAAFADIIIPLALLDFLGMKISAAGIAAFLMLIGYSVDTDILLTTRVLKKREGTVNHRIYSSFKTGIFMTSTALLAVLPAFFIVTGLPDSFRQIFLILALGLSADIINTWLTNASIIKWYTDAKKLK